jgi:hypothetical protein
MPGFYFVASPDDYVSALQVAKGASASYRVFCVGIEQRLVAREMNQVSVHENKFFLQEASGQRQIQRTCRA